MKLGTYDVNPPVVLAPMAGITNVAFRRLCREQGGGVYVCEMITTRALVERIPKTLKMIAFAEDEELRSLQLYGVDPDVTAAAVRMVGEDDLLVGDQRGRQIFSQASAVPRSRCSTCSSSFRTSRTP